MIRLLSLLIASLVLAGSIVAGCAQASPAPTPKPSAPSPTTPPAPLKSAAEPTKAVAAAPTAAPAASTAPPKVAFPEKGRSITINCPWPAGGNNDILARILAAGMEKELGVSVRVENKPGAASQTGLAEFVRAKPDGYTMALTSLPSTLTVYMEPERKATFTGKDMLPVAMIIVDPLVFEVKGDGRFKTIKDIYDAAKVNPDKVRIGDSGVGSGPHLASMLIAKAGGVTYSYVHFDGDPPGMAAVLGEHIEGHVGAPAAVLPQVKSGAMRILGHTDSEPDFAPMPGVKSLRSQGYDVVFSLLRGMSVPAGTPKDVVSVLETTIKRVADSSEFRTKVTEAGLTIRYLDSAGYARLWTDMEKQVEPLIKEMKAESAPPKK